MPPKKPLLVLLSLTAVAALAASGLASGDDSEPSSAHAGHGQKVTVEPLVHSTIGAKVRADGSGVSLRTSGPKDIMTAAITVEPGGSFGWHSHPGPVQVAIADGTFSLYQVEDRRCRKQNFGPGQAFVEDGGRVHLGQNEGSETVRIFATFLARAGTTVFTQAERIPDACR
jgi:quercetin dioxygenase-like cupin family protein